MLSRSRNRVLWSVLAAALLSVPAHGQAPAPRDGQRDFDWEIGTWNTRLSRLQKPLTGSTTWVEYTGTTVVRKVWDGRANLAELAVEGPAGRLEGLSLRLYDPRSRQWSLNFASLRNGALTAPVYGSFDGRGRGLFFGQDMLEGRAVLVRFIITQVSRTEARFEQSYSADGGATWEVNWLAVDRLL